MESGSPTTLEFPSFLLGPYAQAHRKAMREGRRCAERYLNDGSLPAPRELLTVPPGAVVLTDKSIDFRRESHAWRLYLLEDVLEGFFKALDWKDTPHLMDIYEASCRDTAWGALHYAISHMAPMGAGRLALRLQSVLRFWDSLQAARYLFSSPGASLTLDELMTTACDWAMQAWVPEGGASVRSCLGVAAERMVRATKADSIEAILRQLPRVLPLAHGLKHKEKLADPSLWRERLATLEQASFDRISAAMTANLLQRLYLWDRQMDGDAQAQ